MLGVVFIIRLSNYFADLECDSRLSRLSPKSIEFLEDQKTFVLPLERGRDRLFVKAKINDIEAGYFLIDTGAYCSTVNPATAKSLDLPNSGYVEIVRIEGMRVSPGNRVNSMSLGGLKLGPHTLSVEKSGFEERNNNIVGTLGSPLFSHVPFTIDYPNSKLILYNPKYFQPPANQHSEPLSMHRGGTPVIKVRINGTTEGRFDLDTGSSGMLLQTPFAKKHPEILKRTESSHRNINNVRFSIHLLDSIEMLGKVHKNAPVHVSSKKTDGLMGDETDGLIGSDFIKDSRVTFDYQNKRLWIERSVENSSRDVNSKDFFGQTQLMEAADSGDAEKARQLLARGARVNERDPHGWSALVKASWADHEKIVKILVEAGAEVDATNEKGVNALFFASAHGKVDIVKTLLAHGANPNFKYSEDINPLMTAVRKGKSQVVELLLENGAEVGVRSGPCKATVLMTASRKDEPEIVQSLLRHGAQVNAGCQDGDTALINAASAGNADVVKVLLRNGADVNEKNKKNETALTCARKNKYSEIEKLLKEVGAKE